MNKPTNKPAQRLTYPDIKILIATVILTASTTFGIIRTVIIQRHILIDEQYKLEIQRLEKIIDQGEKIRNLDSSISILKTLLQDQARINTLKSSTKQDQKKQIQAVIKFIPALNSAIKEGERILSLEQSDNSTYESFSAWRNQCSALLGEVDSESHTTYKTSFLSITANNRSEYQVLHGKIKEGLYILTGLSSSLK